MSVRTRLTCTQSRRENTVLRGQLFDTNPDGSKVVRNNVYVIPHALVSGQFRPADTPLSSDISEYHFFGALSILGSFLCYVIWISNLSYFIVLRDN